MLGTEPQIIETYVEPGQARLVYWPMLDHGSASRNAHAAADCIGRQDVDAFWLAHDQFYADQSQLWSADLDYFRQAAASVGVDADIFAACYESGDAHARVEALDQQRRDAGIFVRPSFVINGQSLFGAQPFDVFSDYIEAGLDAQSGS